MKKVVSIFMAAVMLLSLFVVSFYAEEQNNEILAEESVEELGISPRSGLVTGVSSSLTISSRTATCKSTVSCDQLVTSVYVEQKLQKKSGNSWTTVKTWTNTFYSRSFTFTNQKTSLPTGTYRVYTYVKAYQGNVYGTATSTSSSVTI